MRIFNLLLTSTLLAVLGNVSLIAHAADSAIKMTSIAQVDVEVTDKKGNKTYKRGPVTKAVPGTEVIYTTTFKNTIDKAVGNMSSTTRSRMPPNTRRAARSARIVKSCSLPTAARPSPTPKS